MRVLHVIPSVATTHGGPSEAIRLMEKGLSSLGVPITTVTTDDDGPGRRKATASDHHTPSSVSRIYFRKRLEFYKVAPGMVPWLWRHITEFDVVHIHALFSFSSTVAALVARLKGVPYVLRPLGTLTHYGVTQRRHRIKRASLSWLEAPALRCAAAVHFTSEAEQREAATLGIPMKGVVIPLGIESVQRERDGLVAARFPPLRGHRYALYLSRLDPKKNLEALLHAFAANRAKWPDVKLLVAGDGSATYVQSLKGLADRLDLDDSVLWAGHIGGALKESALANATVFVLPSFSENFGIAAAEALMAGLPCILGSGVAIAKDVAEAGAGLAIAPDAESLGAALDQLLGDAHSRNEMSSRAAALAQDRYSVESMGSSLVRLYTRLVAG